VLTDAQHLLFVEITSLVALLGGLALWAGFALMGLVARRFEQAFGQPTPWLFLMVAPMGLFLYLLMQSLASLQHENMNSIEQWIGYTLLIWSALLCGWGSLRFRKILAELARESR
jgi:hypothetical protein